MLNHWANYVTIDIDRITRLAILNGHLDIVEHLVESRGASLTSRDTGGTSPTLCATMSPTPHMHVLKFLAAKLGAKEFEREINHQDLNENLLVVRARNLNSIELLIFCIQYGGADPDRNDCNALSHMVDKSTSKITELLVTFICDLRPWLKMPLYLSDRLDGSFETWTVQKMVHEARAQTAQRKKDLVWLHVPWTNVRCVAEVYDLY